MSTVRIAVKKSTASGHRAGWWKQITGIDATKTNGYALQGEFLRDGEHDLPLGALVVENWPTGSARSGGESAELFRVGPEGLSSIAQCKNWRQEFLSFRDAISAALQPDPRQALRDEHTALRARLAEIDALLAEDASNGARA